MIRDLLLVASLLPIVWACGSNGVQQGAEPRAKVSDAAPAFSARDQTGTLRTLHEFRGKYVILYFYPKDATPGCTKEACAFRDRWSDFAAAGAQVLGVSLDAVESHIAFANEHQLPFPLLADVEGHIAAAYNVPVAFGMARRMTFVIDKRGVIRRIFADVDPAVHADEVLATLASLAEVERNATRR